MTTFPASHADLLDAKFAALTTIGRDGIPQSTVIWFLHHEGDLRISLSTTRRKTKNLLARPECSLLIVDLENPMRYVDIRGRARIEPDDQYAFADLVGAKYSADLRQYDPPGTARVIVTIEPTKVYAVDMS